MHAAALAQGVPKGPSPDFDYKSPPVDIDDKDCLRMNITRGRGFLHLTAHGTRMMALRAVEEQTKLGRVVTCVSLSLDSVFFSQHADRCRGPPTLRGRARRRAVQCVTPPPLL